MDNQMASLNRKVRKAQAYQQELRETGELDYRMELVAKMKSGELTHKEAMAKLKEWQRQMK